MNGERKLNLNLVAQYPASSRHVPPAVDKLLPPPLYSECENNLNWYRPLFSLTAQNIYRIPPTTQTPSGTSNTISNALDGLEKKNRKEGKTMTQHGDDITIRRGGVIAPPSVGNCLSSWRNTHLVAASEYYRKAEKAAGVAVYVRHGLVRALCLAAAKMRWMRS